MGQLTLSPLQKKHYKEIKRLFSQSDSQAITLDYKDHVRMQETLSLLELLGYIRDINADGGYIYFQVADFKDFEKWHKDKQHEEMMLSRREWSIAIVSALLGAIVGLLPTIIPIIKGFIK